MIYGSPKINALWSSDRYITDNREKVFPKMFKNIYVICKLHKDILTVLAGKTGLLRPFIYSVGTERYMQSDWKLLKWGCNSEFLCKIISLSLLTIIELSDFACFCRPCPSPYKGLSSKVFKGTRKTNQSGCQ